MRRIVLTAFLALAAALTGAAIHAQSIPAPGTNTPLMGCVDGRAVRTIGSNLACSTTVAPTVSNCGTGATMSPLATDFIGQIVTGSSLISACTVTFSKLYSSFGCLAQSNTSSSAVASAPVMGTANSKTTMTINLTLALTSGKVMYICGPV